MGTVSSIHRRSDEIYAIHPIEDARWHFFVAAHEAATVFHSTSWLEAIYRTYRYIPVAYTTSPPGTPLQNGIVFCRVNSLLTGRRLVSVPFADHCRPLCSDIELAAILSKLQTSVTGDRVQYIEVRPTSALQIQSPVFHSQASYAWHVLDLEPDIETLLRNCHKSGVQRKVRRAEREALYYEEGRTEALLGSFYELHSLTRRRQGIPPHPKQWFRNLLACFGETLKIRAAFKGDQCVASIMTIRHKDCVVFKYGASDPRFNNLGGTQLLLWRTVLEAKREGCKRLDLGRSDFSTPGLITFKDRWGARRSTLTYSRFTASADASKNFAPSGAKQPPAAVTLICSHLPVCVLRFAGNVLYRHVG